MLTMLITKVAMKIKVGKNVIVQRRKFAEKEKMTSLLCCFSQIREGQPKRTFQRALRAAQRKDYPSPRHSYFKGCSFIGAFKLCHLSDTLGWVKKLKAKAVKSKI